MHSPLFTRSIWFRGIPIAQFFVHTWHLPQLSRGLSIYTILAPEVIAKKAPIGHKYRQKKRSTKAEATRARTRRMSPGSRLFRTIPTAGTAPIVNSIPNASHGLIDESDREPATHPRTRSAARITYFKPFRMRSALPESLILFLVHFEKILNTQSVIAPKAHIQPQKNRPARIVTGTTQTNARRSGQMADERKSLSQ